MSQRQLIVTVTSIAALLAAISGYMHWSASPKTAARVHAATSAVLAAQVSAQAEASPAIGPQTRADFNRTRFQIPAPFVPPQCYTKASETDLQGKEQGRNPCYVCHNEPEEPNFIEDLELQSEYSFAKEARENPWSNLFIDRSAAIAQVSDDEILKYVRTSNYFDSDGQIVLAKALAALDEAWDADGNGKWDGFVPDVTFHFDEAGFDVSPSGKETGWRAFAYYPFQGTFWPTNGSAGDVMMRLPAHFQQDEAGKPSREAYVLNFAIVEALAKKADVKIAATDERRWGVDLNADGQLGMATHVAFNWAPRQGKTMSYVGKARSVYKERDVEIAAGLLPVGTEILHTVRYLDVQDGKVTMAARLKELRYARKTVHRTYSQLRESAFVEAKEKGELPDRLRELRGDTEAGLSNGQGWRYFSFIEDQNGNLRPQTFEETAFCMGCHGGVSQTRDGVFSFMRKLDGDAHARGWYHWSQKGIETLAEPQRADGQGAYSLYLRENHAGDEFRANNEVIEKFFHADGSEKADSFDKLRSDISYLLLPSPERALALNKAYREVVKEQSYVRGRDAVLSPPQNVHRQVEDGQSSGVSHIVTSDFASSH